MTESVENKNLNMSLIELSRFFSVDITGPPSLLIPSVSLEEYTESICPDNYSKENFSSSSPQVLIGQGINHNAGLQLNQIIGSKLPSYEDFATRGAATFNHKRTMLDGLLASTGLEAPSTSFKTLADLSSKLLQLPTKKTAVEEHARSTNGLPYFDENESLYRISQLKKSQKLKDVEYLHGAVILNQLVNNKRKLRNYQWKQFFADRTGNSATNNLQKSLRSNIREGSILLDEEALLAEEREQQEKLKAKIQNPLHDPSQSLLDPIPEKVVADDTATQAALKLKEEQEAKLKRESDRAQEQALRTDIKKRKRFIYDQDEYTRDMLKDTVIIEEEVITQNLNYIPSYQNNQPPEVRKLVRKRRRPNANSIGHSNIRGVKPNYWK